MVVGPGQKDIYVKTCGDEENKLLWYRIDGEGKPAKAGEATGRGLGPTAHSNYSGILQTAPGGKHLYSISAEEHAIACIERKPGGEIA
jgi:hypothetical protein